MPVPTAASLLFATTGSPFPRRLMEQIGGTLEVNGAPSTTWTLRFPLTSAADAAAA
jgi:hypothetical protein